MTVGRVAVGLEPDHAPRGEIDLPTALAALLERWRLLVGAVGAVSLAVLAVLLLMPQRYQAVMTLSTVSSSALQPGGLAASLLAAASQGGLQATPPFLVELMHMPGVLTQVAESKLSEGSSERVIDRIARSSGADSIRVYRIPEVMQGLMRTSVQRETGTITLTVTHKDSVLARAVAQRLVDEVGRAFVQAAKAQANELRRAQQARVDSASRQLGQAQDNLIAFLRRNRAVPAYSPDAVVQQRLQRAVDLAQQVYGLAVTDREAAIAKELQDTPALVVIDSLPRRLPPVPRHRLLKLLLTVVFATTAVSFVIVFHETLRYPAGQRPDSLLRLRSAARRLPLVGRLMVR